MSPATGAQGPEINKHHNPLQSVIAARNFRVIFRSVTPTAEIH